MSAADTAPPADRPAANWALRIQGLMAVIGVLIADHLLQVHILTNFGGGADSGLCAAAEGFSCADAAQSDFAKIGSLPIAALGEAYYLALLALTAVQRFKPSASRLGPHLVFFSALLGVGYSGFLAYVSAVEVGAWCPWCMGLYGVNVVLLLVGFKTLPAGVGGAFGDIPKLFKSGLTYLVIVALVGATFATQGIYVYKANKMVAAHNAQYEKLNPNKAKHLDVRSEGTASHGPASAPVELVEYSDFQCPHCRRLARTLRVVSEREPDLLRYHFKHYPMDSSCNPHVKGKFHDNACRAAVAGVCAQRQGRFWQMHDKMFANQRKLSDEDLDGYAQEIGLDVELYRACVKDPEAMKRVVRDIEEGYKDTVRGTPTFFLNGWRTVGGRPADALQGMVRQTAKNALKKKQKAAAQPEAPAQPETPAQPVAPAQPEAPAHDAPAQPDAPSEKTAVDDKAAGDAGTPAP